jgi:adenine-specific DNA-methyltransferase
LKTVWRESRPGAKELWDKYIELRKEHGEAHQAIETELQDWFKDLPKEHPAKALSRFKHVDRFGPWRDRDISWPGGGGPRYNVVHKDTGKPCKVPERGWIYPTIEKMKEMIELGLVEFRKDHTEPPIRKAHLRPVSEELIEDEELLEQDDEDVEPEELGLQVMGSVIYKQSQVTIKLFRQIMGAVKFNNPKDHEILSRLFNYVTNSDKNAIFLDAFAGSATSGHAVLSLNKADGGTRRFVLIESEDEYIDELTCERLRRVIKGVPKAKNQVLRDGLGGSFSFIEVGHPMRLETLLKADKLPSYADLAGYVFYTATGEDFDSRRIKGESGFIGESAQYDVYLLYRPSLEYLKTTALTLDIARSLPKGSGKKRLVFAPTKYLDSIHLDEHQIEFCQLPFEIYKAAKRNP